jgi:hypothetical protein
LKQGYRHLAMLLSMVTGATLAMVWVLTFLGRAGLVSPFVLITWTGETAGFGITSIVLLERRTMPAPAQPEEDTSA